MGKLIMLVGLPASGKSTYAKNLNKKIDNSIILSSDSLREELYGDESIQGNNVKLFEELHRRAREGLLAGKTVIYDATNISSKRRRGFLNNLNGRNYKNIIRECYYFDTPLEEIIRNNKNRDRQVSIGVIERMRLGLTVPMYSEGFDKIEIIRRKEKREKIKIGKLLEEIVPYYDFIRIMEDVEEFRPNIELPQDSKYHTFSVSRHIYYVHKYIMENFKDDLNFKELVLASIFHDIGKAYTKDFKEDARYANFIGHENISGQMALSILLDIGVNEEIALNVVELIQLHMRIGDGEEGVNKKLLKLIGEKKYDLLIRFKEADMSAK